MLALALLKKQEIEISINKIKEEIMIKVYDKELVKQVLNSTIRELREMLEKKLI